MPSGGTTPLSEEDWEYVLKTYDDACEVGLQNEWLRWFAGGLWIDKVDPRAAAWAAAIEWDF